MPQNSKSNVIKQHHTTQDDYFYTTMETLISASVPGLHKCINIIRYDFQ